MIVELPSSLASRIRHYEERRTSDDTKHSSGGFQSHVEDTAARLTLGSIDVDDAYIGRTWRHAYAYKGGGWNKTCEKILSALTFALQAGMTE